MSFGQSLRDILEISNDSSHGLKVSVLGLKSHAPHVIKRTASIMMVMVMSTVNM